MTDVYICFCCGYPIIFRRWRGKPRQIFHIPTGWPCWNLWEAGLCRPGLPERVAFARSTPPKERRRLLRQANRQYRQYLRTGNVKPLVGLVTKHLESQKGDVVGELLADLGEEEEARPLMRSIMGSTAWKAFSRRMRRDRLHADYRQTQDAKPILQYLQVLIARGDSQEALEIAEYALDLIEDVGSKVTCWFEGICARELSGDSEAGDREILRLIAYLRALRTRVRVTKRGFGLLLATIQKRLEGERRDKLLLLWSVLTGEGRLGDLQKTVAVPGR